MDHYSLPPLRDGWLSWPCWLTDSGRLNHKAVTHPASSLAQDRESLPAETSVLTTMLRRHQNVRYYYYYYYNCQHYNYKWHTKGHEKSGGHGALDPYVLEMPLVTVLFKYSVCEFLRGIFNIKL